MTFEERAERMIELVDRRNGYQSARLVGQSNLLWHSADKQLMAHRLKAMRGTIAGAIREAVADRDMEWWQALALVDNVAPNPQAVKEWLAVYEKHVVEQAVAAERERCAARAEQEAAEYDAMEPDHYDPAVVCRALAKAIREGK